MSLFLFLAVGAVALFTATSIAHWVDARAAERKMSERFALLRKVSDQPAESARLVIDFLREDEAREEQAERRRAQTARKDGIGAGLMVIATGVGLTIMLAAISPNKPVWTVGLIPLLVGAVIFLLAFFDKAADSVLTKEEPR